MPLPKKLLFSTLLLVILVSTVEGLAFVSYKIIFAIPYSQGHILDQRNQILSDKSGDSQEERRQRAYLIHPYYGYVSDTSAEAQTTDGQQINTARSFGFDSDGQIIPDYPEQVFTVAVMGGSVAKYFAANMAEELKRYIEKLSSAQGKKIVILNLGNYSYKEPQQLLILNDLVALGARLDVVVNIDGFNEIAHPLAHNAPNGVFPFFPSGWADRTGEMTSSKELAVLGKIQGMRDLRVGLATVFSALPDFCVTANVLWATLDSMAVKKIQGLETARLKAAPPLEKTFGQPMGKGASGKVSFGPSREFPPNEFYPAAAKHWAVASALANNMVLAQGGRYFHFLQPNQYDTGSKQLNWDELARAYNPSSPYKACVEGGYASLKKAGISLAASNVEFTDLTGLFAKDSRSLYADDCCHYTRVGETLVADAIGNTILDHWSHPGRLADVGTLRNQLEQSLGDPGRVVRLANLACDLLGDFPSRDVSVQGLWEVETNPGKPQERWRWGLGPGTSIHFLAPQGAMVRLSITVLSTLPGQEISILHNGRAVEKMDCLDPSGHGAESVKKTVTFPTASGDNEIILAYKTWNHKETPSCQDGDQRALAAVFYDFHLETLPATGEGTN